MDNTPMKLTQNNRVQKSTVGQEHKEDIAIGLIDEKYDKRMYEQCHTYKFGSLDDVDIYFRKNMIIIFGKLSSYRC